MTGLDIAKIERALQELRDRLVPRDKVQAFNDASATLLKHFITRMAASWTGDGTASIATVVVPVAYLVANRIVQPAAIDAKAVADAVAKVSRSAGLSPGITAKVVTLWVERFTNQSCNPHEFAPVVDLDGIVTTEFCKACLARGRVVTNSTSVPVLVEVRKQHNKKVRLAGISDDLNGMIKNADLHRIEEMQKMAKKEEENAFPKYIVIRTRNWFGNASAVTNGKQPRVTFNKEGGVRHAAEIKN